MRGGNAPAEKWKGINKPPRGGAGGDRPRRKMRPNVSQNLESEKRFASRKRQSLPMFVRHIRAVCKSIFTSSGQSTFILSTKLISLARVMGFINTGLKMGAMKWLSTRMGLFRALGKAMWRLYRIILRIYWVKTIPIVLIRFKLYSFFYFVRQ